MEISGYQHSLKYQPNTGIQFDLHPNALKVGSSLTLLPLTPNPLGNASNIKRRTEWNTRSQWGIRCDFNKI